MARNSNKARDQRRIVLINKHAAKRDTARATLNSATASEEDKMEADRVLQSIPPNARTTRNTRRCNCCGRPRAVYRRFGLCRICLRWAVQNGFVPGARIASW